MDISIVIPTRALSFGLDAAVQSALSLQGSIRELVISVNTTDRDTVRTVTEKYPEARVVAPPRGLRHASHWEFALGQASGEWVALVTDRGVLRRDWLTTLVHQTVQARLITFRSMAVMRQGPCHFVVQLPWFSGETTQHSSAPWVEAGRNMQFSEHGPYLLNSLVHRSVLEEIRQRAGCVCGDLVGDCGFYARCLAAGIDWLHIEKPLVVMHSAETGIGASLVTGSRTPALEAFLRDLASAGGFRHAPLPEIATNMNVRANEFAAAFPGSLLDASAYASALAAELAAQRETFPGDAHAQLTAFVRTNNLSLPPSRPRRKLRGLARRVAHYCLGTGTSPIHRRLNLPVRTFGSPDKALAWATKEQLFPNRAHGRDGVWGGMVV